MLTRTAKEPFIGSDATPEYLAELKQKIAARGLAVNMGALRMKFDLPLAEQIKDTRQQIDNGKTMGVEFLLTFGANNAGAIRELLQADAGRGGLCAGARPEGGVEAARGRERRGGGNPCAAWTR